MGCEDSAIGSGAGIPAAGILAEVALWRTVADRVLPEIAGRRLQTRIWCAGPSAVVEGLSLAASWHRAGLEHGFDLHLLLTGPDPALRREELGQEWSEQDLTGVPAALREALFVGSGDGWTAGAWLRQHLAVAGLDLDRAPWPRQVDLMSARGLGAPGDVVGAARLAEQIAPALLSHGWLLADWDEAQAAAITGFDRFDPELPLFRRRD